MLKFHDLGHMFINQEGKLQSRKVDQQIQREMLSEAIIKHNLSYSFVEYDGIRNWINYISPDVVMPCRNTEVADIRKMHIREKEKLKQELAKISNRVCLTSDCWTSSTSEGYICLTAQFVDESWRLNCKILNFCRMYPPHTGVEMAAVIYDCLKEWNIDKKVFSITLDNVTANDRLKAATNSLIAIRESVKHVRGSDGRMQKFEQCVKQVGIETNLGLRLDVVTRWNSTYLMLERALPYEKISLVKNKLYELFDDYTEKQNVARDSTTIRTTPSVARRKSKVFNEFKAFENETVSSDGKSKLDLYLEEPKLEYEKFQDMDVFMYWKDCSNRYPELSVMARDVLSIPITTVSSESSFSIGGHENEDVKTTFPQVDSDMLDEDDHEVLDTPYVS
ncbi:zinc finger BED domain-containing protein DAYSLEEPER-like [Solanum pennellii]|uniref:Zinc finger BED domain-containing protein DAYSLEEPER-like n=1 Tax=Solanum pennellii TaxID=28526 RepID=A0ABM1UYD6_SOLPN|nr:zinc finger BED domain-containing protein DAYSLEEPER-like [Solanum pennellii]